MNPFDAADTLMRERAREVNRINRTGWMYEPLRLCREAQHRLRFRMRRSATNLPTPDC